MGGVPNFVCGPIFIVIKLAVPRNRCVFENRSHDQIANFSFILFRSKFLDPSNSTNCSSMYHPPSIPVSHQQMNNIAAQLRQLSIELEEGDVCFAPGDVVSGFVVIGVSQPPAAFQAPPPYSDEAGGGGGMDQQYLEVMELKLRVYGGAKVKGRSKTNSTNEETYLELEMDLGQRLDGTDVRPGSEKLVKFEFQLPHAGLCTSIETKSASVLYTLRAALVYRNINNEIKRINAVRGFSIVERFDLSLLPKSYFQPAYHHLVKKFGLFSCTGGQIRLHFSICRSAFVCGENIIIEGRLENKTDRRVDKVSAVLQQVVVVHGSSKDSNLNLLDVADIHEDNLALFVDQGTTLKIDRYFALPPLPPSTVALDGTDPSSFGDEPVAELQLDHHRGSHHQLQLADFARGHRRSFSGPRGSLLPLGHGVGQQQPHRFLKVLYQLSVRVKTGGVEVMEINVPVVIGSLPQRKIGGGGGGMLGACRGAQPGPAGPQNTFTRAAREAAPSAHRARLFRVHGGGDEGEPQALFMQSRKDVTAKLGAPNEAYICSKSQLAFTNKYPFYVNMPTSSKQSRKVSMLANAIRAENTFVAALRQEQSLVNEWKKRKEQEEKAGRGVGMGSGASRTLLEPGSGLETESAEPETATTTPPNPVNQISPDLAHDVAATHKPSSSPPTDPTPMTLAVGDASGLATPPPTAAAPQASDPMPTVTVASVPQAPVPLPLPTMVTTVTTTTLGGFHHPHHPAARGSLPPVEVLVTQMKRGHSMSDLS